MLDIYDPLRGAEFPHDNPELFSGPGWLAVDPCGGPKAIAWASRRDLHYPGAPVRSVVREERPVQPAQPTPPGLAVAPPPPPGEAPAPVHTDFDRLLSAVRAVLSDDQDPALALELEQFLCGDDPRATAWRRLLCGQKSDLAECGDRPLDEWISGLIAARLGCDAATSAALRRALRKRGVAAFGMLNT